MGYIPIGLNRGAVALPQEITKYSAADILDLWTHYVADVGYFLISALTEEDRRKNEADLLDEYRKTLRVPDDQRPSGDQMWARYRATPIYGLAIWLSTLGTDGWQRSDVSLTLCQRFSAAFLELDTLQALKSVDL